MTSWDDWEEPEECLSLCLFCSTTQQQQQILDHLKMKHQCDLQYIHDEWHLDFYSMTRLINFFRKQQQQQQQQLNTEITWTDFNITPDHPLFGDDSYLTPVIDDDSLLMYDFDQNSDEVQQIFPQTDLQDRFDQLEIAYKQLLSFAQRTIVDKEDHSVPQEDDDDIDDCDSDSENDIKATLMKTVGASDYDSYFQSYARFSIHEEMLSDSVRTGTYQKFFLCNPQIVKDKVVLDVGAGTGILSMFAAQAGAKRVFAVEASSMARAAKQLIKVNNLSSVITVFEDRVEQVVLPEKVDLIISEWMGYYLFYENMLGSILYARNKWLAPGGVVQPSHASVFLGALGSSDRCRFRMSSFDDMYGLNFSDIRPLAFREAGIEFVDKGELVGQCSLATIDCNKIMAEELQELKYSFELIIQEKTCSCYGFVGWFDISFSQNCQEPFEAFSTGPGAPDTHWKQTTLYLLEPVLDLRAGDIFRGFLSFRIPKHRTHAQEVSVSFFVKSDHQRNDNDKEYSQYFLV